jgi:hypothetical protein
VLWLCLKNSHLLEEVVNRTRRDPKEEKRKERERKEERGKENKGREEKRNEGEIFATM